MTEAKKTGIFAAAAALMLAIGLFAAWPTTQQDSTNLAGQQLFEKFEDPLAAAQLRVVSFNEDKGELSRFTVRKQGESELWTIESRSDYPADAVDQVKAAATSLIGLEVLDTQTTNAEDHDDLGVVEPDESKLEVGDTGVGRLVSFKDRSGNTLASIIVGNEVRGEPEKRYVRVPGQDPVYVVKFDDSVFTTEFKDWIEEDLLQLSSIDIAEIEIRDYAASLTRDARGLGIDLKRNYAATVKPDGNDWELVSLGKYTDNTLSEPEPDELGEGESLNNDKLNDLKNALDDLEFVDVLRKPQGMSVSLKADEDLLNNEEALQSLASRGFYPAGRGEGGETEILSANGELSVSTKAGVRYTLRFGNTASVDVGGSDSEDADADAGGVNRYLLVTTSVDEDQFPPPELDSIPQSVDELKTSRAEAEGDTPEATDGSEAEGTTEPDESIDNEAPDDDDKPMQPAIDPVREADVLDEVDPAMDEPDVTEPEGGSGSPVDDASAEQAEPTDSEEAANVETSGSDTDGEAEGDSVREVVEELTETDPATGEGQTEGTATAEGSGGGQQPEPDAEPGSSEENADDDGDTAGDQPADSPGSTTADGEADGANGEADGEADGADESSTDGNNAAEEAAGEEAAGDGDAQEKLTEEEWQELLEAEQEKITKANQRKMDERKDKIAEAERKVRELNARFADWYYVIPESTYDDLKVGRDQLIQTEGQDSDEATTDDGAGGLPNFNFPGVSP